MMPAMRAPPLRVCRSRCSRPSSRGLPMRCAAAPANHRNGPSRSPPSSTKMSTSSASSRPCRALRPDPRPRSRWPARRQCRLLARLGGGRGFRGAAFDLEGVRLPPWRRQNTWLRHAPSARAAAVTFGFRRSASRRSAASRFPASGVPLRPAFRGKAARLLLPRRRCVRFQAFGLSLLASSRRCVPHRRLPALPLLPRQGDPGAPLRRARRRCAPLQGVRLRAFRRDPRASARSASAAASARLLGCRGARPQRVFGALRGAISFERVTSSSARRAASCLAIFLFSLGFRRAASSAAKPLGFGPFGGKALGWTRCSAASRSASACSAARRSLLAGLPLLRRQAFGLELGRATKGRADFQLGVAQAGHGGANAAYNGTCARVCCSARWRRARVGNRPDRGDAIGIGRHAGGDRRFT